MLSRDKMNLRYISIPLVGVWWVLAIIGYTHSPKQFDITMIIQAIAVSIVVIVICEVGNMYSLEG